MLELCAVALGGALGAVGRYAVGLAVAALAPEAFLGGFPVATLIANVLGCFVIGVLSALFEGPFAGRDHVRLFAVTGVLGGFTTFSTFSLETVQLLESGAWGMAGSNAAVSLGACLAGVMAGRAIVHACLGTRG
ncbi:fluoride efflux transporter CrcB [Slackia sp.]|uniref:fluoride efflux transporter CrcB n=1 Tax=Slackia sp. TaxID=2049041 RepID=UPI003A97A3C3